VIANRQTLRVDEIIDLRSISDGEKALGWCRGLLPVDERQCGQVSPGCEKPSSQKTFSGHEHLA